MLLFNNSEVYQPIYNRLKVYPTFMRLYKFNSPSIERLPGYEERKSKTINTTKNATTEEDNLYRSLRRTKTTISDLVLSNDFTIFATFTFKTDRQDIEKCKSKMTNWLKSQQKTYGKFTYLIVPEFHKDKKSIHFHALMHGYKGQLQDSGHKINSRTAYNITSYKSGFSTAIKIDNQAKVSSYVRKYITKDMPQFDGKKRYWISTGLKRPFTDVNTDIATVPYIKWCKSYTSLNLEIYESSDIVKLLTYTEKLQWNSSSLQTLQKPKSYNRSHSWRVPLRRLEESSKPLQLPLVMDTKS